MKSSSIVSKTYTLAWLLPLRRRLSRPGKSHTSERPSWPCEPRRAREPPFCCRLERCVEGCTLENVPWQPWRHFASILPFDSLDLLRFVVDDAPDFDLIQTIHDAFLRSGT